MFVGPFGHCSCDGLAKVSVNNKASATAWNAPDRKGAIVPPTILLRKLVYPTGSGVPAEHRN